MNISISCYSGGYFLGFLPMSKVVTALLQLIRWQRHSFLVFVVCFTLFLINVVWILSDGRGLYMRSLSSNSTLYSPLLGISSPAPMFLISSTLMIPSSIFLWFVIALGHRPFRGLFICCTFLTVPMAWVSIPTSPTQSFWALTSVFAPSLQFQLSKLQTSTDINISNEITCLVVINHHGLWINLRQSYFCHMQILLLPPKIVSTYETVSHPGHGYSGFTGYCAVSSWLLQLSTLWHLTFNISKLQRVQNFAARLALNDWQ